MKRPHVIIVLLTFLGWSGVNADLIALYTFDDPADTHADASGNLNTLSDPALLDQVATWGATTGLDGGGGFTFDGDDRLLAPVDIGPAAIPQMTWGAFVRPDSIAAGLRKVMGHDNGAWDRTLGLDNREGAFRYTSFTGVGRPVVGLSGPANTTDWSFIAAVYDESTTTVTVYLDLDASTSADPLEVASEAGNWGGNPAWPTFAIGGIRPDNASEGWLGAIDNVFVFNELLDASRLSEIRRRGAPEILGIPEGDPEIDSDPSALFGDLTGLGPGPGPVSRKVTIINRGGTQNLEITGIARNGPDRLLYEFTIPPDLVLAPGGETHIEVVFTPPAKGGSFQATLEIISNDALTPRLEIPLDAVVASDPNVEFVHATPLFGTMTFNSVPGTVTRVIKIRNTGVVNTLTLTPLPSVTGPDSASYGLQGPITILPGQERDLEIRLETGGLETDFFAELEISTDDPDAPSYTVSLDASTFVVPPASLLGFYPFDDPAAPLADAAGVSGEGLPAGAPIHETTGGFEGGYYSFTGVDRIIVPINLNPSVLPQTTFGAWVRPDVITPGLRKVIGHDDGAWDRTLGLDNREGAMRYTAFTGTNNNGPVFGTPEPVNTTDWTFLAVAYDNLRADVSVYVDLDASTTGDPLVKVSEPSLMGDGFPTTSIGSIRPDVVNEGWIGCIDNAFFYDGILTDAQLEDLRNRGRAAIVPGEEGIAIIDIARNPDNTVTLTWESNPAPGTIYEVRFSQDLSAPIATWSPDDSVSTQGAQTSHTTQVFNVDELWFVVVQN